MKWLTKFFCLFILSLSSLQASMWTNWAEYPGDPVFFPFSSSSLPDDYYPSVLFDRQKFTGHGERCFYKMYHQAPDGIALSISNDGLNWDLKGVVLKDNAARHATLLYDKHGFGGSLYHYKMWYWTGNQSPVPPTLEIMFTQSIDGETWTTPVAATQDSIHFLSDATVSETPFHEFYGFGQVIYNPLATSIPDQPLTYPYVTYYDSSAAEIAPYTSKQAIALAYSVDGLHWKRYGSAAVVIPSGDINDWDGKHSSRAAVLKLDLDNQYHMFYTAGSSNSIGIAHAFSKDGVSWVKESENPIFLNSDGVEWRRNHACAPTVILVPGKYHFPTILQMWFSGGNSESDKAIGFATLPNPGRS